MSPAELRRAAEEVKQVVTDGLYLCQEPREAFAATIAQLCDHVLSTVRKDDDTPLCFAFATTQPGTRYSCGTLYIRGLELELHSYGIGGNPCYLEGRDGLRIESRGQLRRLLEGLGVACAR